MIVCICNNLTIDHIKFAIQDGCNTALEIHEYYERFPQCATCLDSINEIIKSYKDNS